MCDYVVFLLQVLVWWVSGWVCFKVILRIFFISKGASIKRRIVALRAGSGGLIRAIRVIIIM